MPNIRKTFRSEFFSHVVMLVTGASASQLINIAAAPLLTRLYSPEEFGVYGIFITLSGMLGVLSTGRYEFAILAAKEEKEGWTAMWVVVLSATIAGSAVLLLAFMIDAVAASLLDYELSVSLVALLAVSVGLSGLYTALYYWANRNSHYRSMAASRVYGALTFVVMSIVLAGMGFGGEGLILATVGGMIVNAASLWRTTRAFEQHNGTPTMTQIRECAVRFSSYPKNLIPSGILEQMAQKIHIVVFSVFFGPAVVGALTLYQKVVTVPNTTVANAIRDVFKQRAAKEYGQTGQCARLYMRSMFALLLIGLPPFVILLLFGPALFSLLFGAEWRIAGEYAQVFSFMFYFGFVVAPLGSMIYIAERPQYDLLLQIYLMFATLAALTVGVWYSDIFLAISLYVLARCSKSAVELFVARKLAYG